MNTSAGSINALISSLMIEELIRCGVTEFVLSPGSRCTPLTLAVAENSNANHIIHFDERGAAFYALGQARAMGEPVVLICTSGTAAANYYPAIVEASMDMIPLIVLTADRPPELRATGANQSIDQVGMFGNYVRWQFDLPCPSVEQSPEFILTTIDQAVHRARSTPAGPVHLNCMFREPLAPPDEMIDFTGYLKSIDNWMKRTAPYTTYTPVEIVPNEDEVESIATLLNETECGLIVLGKLTHDESCAALELADKLGWPVLPDISSSVRLGTGGVAELVPYHDLLLLGDMNECTPNTVLHIGGRLTSKRLMTFLRESTDLCYVHVDNHPFRLDPDHTVSHKVSSDPISFCLTASQMVQMDKALPPLCLWNIEQQARIDTVLSEELDKRRDASLTEPMVARVVSQEIVEDGALFVSSSMPIRDMNMFADPSGSNVPVACNRGASGIDGVVASACGFASALSRPTTLVIGDLALLHDLNSLSLTRTLSKPLVVVAINNNGGGIFSFLPIACATELFEPLFGTPHGMNFEHAASMFGLNYVRPDNRASLVSAYKNAQQESNSTIIEITTDRSHNAKIHQLLQAKISTALNKG